MKRVTVKIASNFRTRMSKNASRYTARDELPHSCHDSLRGNLSGCRPGFKAIPTPEAEFNNHAEAAHAKGDVRAISLDSGYDPQLTSGRGARTTAGSGSGGKPGCLAAGTNRRSDICSTQARVEEQLPLVEQRPRSPSVARKLEGEHLLSILDGAHRSTSSGVSGIEEDEGVDGGGFESRRGWGRIGFLQECLLPMKLLEQRRVRSILFVYVLFSVSRAFCVVCFIR